jgi:hypothetical protein
MIVDRKFKKKHRITHIHYQSLIKFIVSYSWPQENDLLNNNTNPQKPSIIKDSSILAIR